MYNTYAHRFDSISFATGNGAIGLRIASEAGAGGILRIFVNHVLLGAGSKRLPTGYFRVHIAEDEVANAGPVGVVLRQQFADGLLVGTITNASTGQEIAHLEAFVQVSQRQCQLDRVIPTLACFYCADACGKLNECQYRYRLGKPESETRNATSVY